MKADDADQRAMDEALGAARKLREERERNPAWERIPLPNFATGPGLPLPLGMNWYESSPEYPGYLLCTYDIEERHYDSSNELGWFKSALLQIRSYGDDRFPPFKWVAVMIANRAEHKGVSTFEKSQQVAAMFDIQNVFNPSCDLDRLIAGAQLDRHPFKFDPGRATARQQQRWLIVERDMEKARGRPKK